MTDSPTIRRISLLAGFAVLILLAACGAEAPTYEPGAVTVTSDPAGAAILRDGNDTGQVTPHTFSGLEPGSYVYSVVLSDYVADPEAAVVDLAPADSDSAHFNLSRTGFSITSPAGASILVDGSDTGKVVPASVAGLEEGNVVVSLQLDGYLISPAESLVPVIQGEITAIPDGTFTARARKTVILEGFANTSCGPCPQLTDNLLALTAKPEFSADRVQFIEFAVSWPQLSDPFFLENAEGNAERYNLYHVGEAPDLYIDGIRQDNALDAAAMESAVLDALAEDPGFLVDVVADFTVSPVEATVSLTAQRDVDLTGYAIYVAIYEKEILFEAAPGTNGQTEFHHVFRERNTSAPPLGVLTVDQPRHYLLPVGDNEAGDDAYVVIAFVQNQTDLSILQCGSTALTAEERKIR